MSPTPPVQFRVPVDLLKRIDAAAEAAGVTRTRWVFDACEAQLSRQLVPTGGAGATGETDSGG